MNPDGEHFKYEAYGSTARRVLALLGVDVRSNAPTSRAKPTLEELRLRAQLAGNESPERVAAANQGKGRINRVAAVVDYVRARARVDGRCEGCGDEARFNGDRDGKAFFFVHHIHALGADGPDTIQNCIALCPICHAEVHFGVNQVEFNAGLRDKLDAILALVAA